jgi:hypothetical protein
VEGVRSAIARRESLGRPVDEDAIRERFRPAVVAALRSLGVDAADAIEVEGRRLWSGVWGAAMGVGDAE